MKKETNYEHYKDEIINAIIYGTVCEFKRRYIIESVNCDYENGSCTACDRKTKKWFNASYEEPKLEIDWEKVPNDTPVYVSDYNECPTDTSLYRHFSTYFKNSHAPFEVWAEGKTSFTTAEVSSYRYCSLAREEDIEKYAKK